MLAAAFIAPPVLSFAFFGCNRVDKKDLDPVNNPSSANQAQLARTLEEVARLHPAYLFAGGDLVNGYADDDGTTLKTQLAGWSKEVASFPKSIRLVAVPGNHELNKKVGDQRMASTLTYPVWKSWLSQTGYTFGNNGPTPASDPKDDLTLDESKMSYTLDQGGVRIIVLNTDTRTFRKDDLTGTTLGWVPSEWARQQLIRAERDPKIKSVFMLGHRNLVDPSKGTGDAPIDRTAASRLIDAMKGKSKLRAYICAHVHAWNVSPILGTGAVQLIAGDGGSKLEEGATPQFGWLEIRAYADGSAGYIHHFRPVPKPYNSPDKAAPSQAATEVKIPN